ncbi:transposase [Streptomyces sp. NPDC002409]
MSTPSSGAGGKGPDRRAPRPGPPGRGPRAGIRDPEPTAGVIDAQPVKGAASVPAATGGFDGGKKVNGRKWHIVVDILGLLPAVMVTTASVTDRDAGQTLLARLRDRHWRVTRVWADGGCTGRLIDFARDAWRIALTVIRRALPHGTDPGAGKVYIHGAGATSKSRSPRLARRDTSRLAPGRHRPRGRGPRSVRAAGARLPAHEARGPAGRAPGRHRGGSGTLGTGPAPTRSTGWKVSRGDPPTANRRAGEPPRRSCARCRRGRTSPVARGRGRRCVSAAGPPGS